MLTTLAIIWVLGVIITAMLAYNHNRNIIGYSVLGLVLSPVISIGVLLMLGERNPNLFINDNRDKVTPEPETVIPEELEPEPEVVEVVEEVVEPVKPVPPVFPEVQVVPEVKKHKSNKSSKKARYTKGKNKGKKPDTQSTSTSTTTTTNTPDNASGIATAAVMTALYVGDDYSDYTTTTTYSSSSDTSSYDSSSSCDSSSSSSGSCD